MPGNIAGHEVFVFAQADHHRRAIARGHDLARVLGGENRQRVDAVQPLDGLAHGVFQRAAVHVLLDQVGDDLGVRLGDELVAFLFQFVLQLDVVFDDAVVHDDDLALAVAMRVGVFFGGPAVRGPARVAEAVDAVDGMLADGLLEIGQFARGAAQFQLAVFADHGDARGIVAAIFEAPEPVEDQGHNFLRADISDYAAHDGISLE